MDTPEIVKTEKEKLGSEECCPKFHPERWNRKTFSWKQKPFIRESVPEFFHIPYPPMIAKKIANMMKLAKDAHKVEENTEDALLLFMDPHPFKSNIYLSVTGNVPNANNTTLSGKFISRVFDGAYNEIPKFMKQMNVYLERQNKKAKNIYVHYAYCPKCAKIEGHNFMIFFAEIDE